MPGSWKIKEVDNSDFTGKYFSVDVDIAGQPHVSYQHITGNTSVLPATQDASGWNRGQLTSFTKHPRFGAV